MRRREAGAYVAWTTLYVSVDSEAKWGQVVGNIVSEWTQIVGLVLLTKQLIERRSVSDLRLGLDEEHPNAI